MFYNHQKAKAFCEYQGLHYCETMAGVADAMLYKTGLSQDSFDAAMQLHISEVARLFSPKNYTFRQRVRIALFFLLNGSLPKQK